MRVAIGAPFCRRVSRVQRLSRKLAPVLLNLPAGHDVAEIQIFRLRLKSGIADVSESVVRAMLRGLIPLRLRAGEGLRRSTRPHASAFVWKAS